MRLLIRLMSRFGRHPGAASAQAAWLPRPAAADPLAASALVRMTPHQLADLPFETLRHRAVQDNAPAGETACPRSTAC